MTIFSPTINYITKTWLIHNLSINYRLPKITKSWIYERLSINVLSMIYRQMIKLSTTYLLSARNHEELPFDGILMAYHISATHCRPIWTMNRISIDDSTTCWWWFALVYRRTIDDVSAICWRTSDNSSMTYYTAVDNLSTIYKHFIHILSTIHQKSIGQLSTNFPLPFSD